MKSPDNTAETTGGALGVPCAFGSQLNKGTTAVFRLKVVIMKANGRRTALGLSTSTIASLMALISKNPVVR